MAPINISARHKEPFIQWREPTSTQVGEAEHRSGRSSSTQATRAEGRRISNNIPPQSNSNSRSSCPESANVNRRVVEREEQVLSHGGRRQLTLQRGSEMHGVACTRSVDSPPHNAESPSFAVPRRTRTSAGEEGGHAHVFQDSAGGRSRASHDMWRRNSSTVQDVDDTTMYRNTCNTTQDAVVRIQQSQNTEIDLERSRIRKASRGSNNGSESPLQSMPFQRASGTRFGSIGVGASTSSSQFQSSQESERQWRAGEQSLNVEEYEENDGYILGEGVPPKPYSFYSNDCDVDLSGDSQEDGEPLGNSEEPASESENLVVDEYAHLHFTETDKRRQRRHALAARVREGDRRFAEGLPRNYLLVDEYHHMPYGVGVGAWRKEVMLLSKSLDPSIGNINHQPQEKVKEIAEWIQHTWQYSRPIKWEFVKEVIARGVSLRRADIWKRMRLNQGKPDGMSDTIWKSLELQLNSPPMMKKIENCKKANASRVNVGRTGPSGEVGVRERLRKRLNRSPSPNEIRIEMERPKGYARGLTRHREVDNVVVPNGNGSGSAQNSLGSHSHNDGSRNLRNDGESHGSLLSRVLDLSEDQVAQHPAFLRVMQRLEALEQRGGISGLPSDMQAEHTVPLPSSVHKTAEENDRASSAKENNTIPISADLDASPQLQEEDETRRCAPPRRSGRPKKKAM